MNEGGPSLIDFGLFFSSSSSFSSFSFQLVGSGASQLAESRVKTSHIATSFGPVDYA